MFIPCICVYTTKTHLSCTDMLSESDFISFKCEAKINARFFNCKVCCILQSTNIGKCECIAEPTFQSHLHTEFKRQQVQCQQVKDTLVYLSHKEHSLVSRTLLDQICQRMLIARFHHLGVITEWQVDEFRGVMTVLQPNSNAPNETGNHSTTMLNEDKQVICNRPATRGQMQIQIHEMPILQIIKMNRIYRFISLEVHMTFGLTAQVVGRLPCRRWNSTVSFHRLYVRWPLRHRNHLCRTVDGSNHFQCRAL